MNTIKNHNLKGSHGKDITLDVYWEDGNQPKPVIVFAHGFKGFKDWGHWELIAEKFALEGFCFIKFNFSHNGVSMSPPKRLEPRIHYGMCQWLKQHD